MHEKINIARVYAGTNAFMASTRMYRPARMHGMYQAVHAWGRPQFFMDLPQPSMHLCIKILLVGHYMCTKYSGHIIIDSGYIHCKFTISIM